MAEIEKPLLKLNGIIKNHNKQNNLETYSLPMKLNGESKHKAMIIESVNFQQRYQSNSKEKE